MENTLAHMESIDIYKQIRFLKDVFAHGKYETEKRGTVSWYPSVR